MPSNIDRRRIIAASGAILVASALPADAQGIQTFRLTVMDGYPPRVLWIREFVDFFIPEVNRRLAAGGRYRIEWSQAWSGQIVKPEGVLEGVENGLGDMAIVTTVFYAARLPLNNLPFYVPFTSSNPRLVGRTMDEIADRFPAFRKQFDDANQVLLTNAATFDSYNLYLAKPAATFSELRGRKINVAGINARYLQPAGAVGVAGSSATYYNNLKTGVVDGAMLWTEGAATFKLNEVAPHILKADLGTAVNKSVTVAKSSWAKLPPPVQQTLKEVSVAYRDRLADDAMRMASESEKAYIAGGGKLTVMPDAERRAWALAMPNIAKEWAGELEAKGVPARAMLAYYMDAMRNAGEKPLRDWDKE